MNTYTAILGGAFDPIHRGHMAMVRWALAQPQVTAVLVIPCWQHPFGKVMAPFTHRLAMCELVCADLPDVTVSAVEQDVGSISYTANTIRALQQQQPAQTFALLVGADAAATFDAWHDAAWLRAHVPLLALPRGPSSPIPDISSTQIRAACSEGKPITALVPNRVADYIAAHHLYGES